jgi:hypothetical protein
MAQQETIFSGPYSHGGYGGPRVMLSTINSEMGVLVGGHGGWVLNHALFVGGSGYCLVNQLETPASTSTERRYIDFGYGGLEVGAIVASNSLIHLRVSTLVGGGGLSSSRRDYHDYDYYGDDMHRSADVFFVAEPNVEMVVNMTSWLRLTAGASYRYVDGIERNSDFSNSDFSGPSGVLSLNFGKF